jgi:dephospho-CoA kinase
MPLKIGITGGIGTGKTLISEIFQVLGIPVYNADNRAKWLMANDSMLISDIQRLLGKNSFTNNNGLDTKFIASMIFGNEVLLQQLNSLVHPAVGLDFEQWVKDQEKSLYILKEAALLFESGSYKTLDYVITVSAPLEIRLRRLEKRDPGRSRQQVLAIIQKQLPEANKIALASDIIYNDDATPVIAQVLKIHAKYRQLAGG